MGLSHPPQFTATKAVHSRARYLATGSTSSITRGNLLNHLFVNQSSNTTNWRVFSGFRLRSIEMWASTPTLGQVVTASVEYVSQYGPSTLFSDTSMGTAEPLHLITRPPKASLADFWSYTGSNESDVLFIITAPANAVVDITYDAVLQNGETPVSFTTTATGVGGTLYMAQLNGPTTTTFGPISYATIT
jgi:hypothetical protein